MPDRLQRKPVGSNCIHEVWRVTYDELNAAATTQTEDLLTLPEGAEADVCWVDIVEAFTTAGSISALGVEVGSSGDPNSLQTSTELLSGPPSTGRVRSQGVLESCSGLAVKAKFTATGANLGDGADSDLTAGIVDVHIVHREF